MVRRLLFLAFAVALVVGFTLPAFANERPPWPPPDYDKDKYTVYASCSCKWKVRVEVNANGGPAPATVEDGKVPEFYCNKWGRGEFYWDKYPGIEHIDVHTELEWPTYLSAYCKLDQDFDPPHKSLYDFDGGCKVEFCKIDFRVVKEKKRGPGRGPDDDD